VKESDMRFVTHPKGKFLLCVGVVEEGSSNIQKKVRPEPIIKKIFVGQDGSLESRRACEDSV
jgi:hypothetical protein